jgi:hypothetical protein
MKYTHYTLPAAKCSPLRGYARPGRARSLIAARLAARSALRADFAPLRQNGSGLMSAKPILRVGKIKATGRSTPISVQGHLNRQRPTSNADHDRTDLNHWIVGSANADLDGLIKDVLVQAKLDSKKLRKDAVIANDIMLSISPEWFRPGDPEANGTWDEDRLRVFKAEALSLLRRTFGKRLVIAVLHLDEATPHIQAVVVPVMKAKDAAVGYRLSSKDMFGPEQLATLQQDWEDRLRPHGVGPRTKGSKARHTTLREYYGALEAFQAEDGRINLEVSQPPLKGLLEPPAAHRSEVEQWRKAEAKRLRDDLRPLAVEAARGRLYDAERRSGIALRGDLADQGQELVRTRLALADTRDELKLRKEQIDALRRTPINTVAATLGYTGAIVARENAIDLVKRVGGLDYHQALAWLAQRFGADIAATAVREHAEPAVKAAVDAAPVLTKGERVKSRVVAQQLDALAAPAYRVTVMCERNGKKVAENLGKSKNDKPETLFNRNEIIGLIPRLTEKNANGWNVYITPIDPAVRHVLADDLTADGLADLKQRGYAPAVVLETSSGNHQAVLKVPIEIDGVGVEKDAVNEWFKDLNRDLGDEKITGLAHPFRLAGFENRKAKHQAEDGRFPFVVLVQSVNRFCRKSIRVVRAYAQRSEALSARSARA